MAKVTLDLAKMDQISDRAAEFGLRSALGKAEEVLKTDILNREGTGELYGKHRASAPGEPPAPDTDFLRTNTNADPTLKEDGGDLVGTVTANTNYALALETGTERMAARPYLRRLASDYRDKLKDAFVRGARVVDGQ